MFRWLCLFQVKITEKPISIMTIPNEPPDRPSLWHDEEGTTAVEYAVMLALIVAVCMGSVSFLTEETKKSFLSSGTAIANATGN